MNPQIAASCEQSVTLLKQYCQEQGDDLVRLSQQLAALFAEGGQLLIAASGSLQATAQQIASHFAFRLSFERPALPAVCLGSDQILNQRMISGRRADQVLVRHYRAINSQNHLLLVLSDGSDADALEAVCEDVIENEQKIAVISFDCDKDSLTELEIGLCLNLGTDLLPRQIELVQFSGHLLCELVEGELFGL